MREYDKNLDREFLEAMNVEVVQHQPWQFSLFYADLEGKFVWYPERGTLMYAKDGYNKKVGEYFDTEEVYEVLMAKVIEQGV